MLPDDAPRYLAPDFDIRYAVIDLIPQVRSSFLGLLQHREGFERRV
jgi:hypothetical protein